MRRMLSLLPAVLFLVPAPASAAPSAAQPEINCESARVPNVPYKTYWDTCKARESAARARSGFAALAGGAVQDNRTTVAGLSSTSLWGMVPTWSDTDILAQFPLTRDTRYMTVPSNPSFQRRISWLYPEDGCFSRAEQVAVRIAAAGKTRPYKLFAFGNWDNGTPLRVYTNNTPSGMVTWGWHTVPVVKNTAGELIVFDAALSPCKPLRWKKWLELMADDMSFHDDVAGGHGVVLGDTNAYFPGQLQQGEPSHATESLNHQTQSYLPLEWARQGELGRDPNVWLGANPPPWTGFACIMTETELTTTTVAANATATVTTSCPLATKVVGGGLMLNSQNLLVSRNSKSSGNGWQIIAKNVGGSSAQLSASAVCLTGAASNQSVSTVTASAVSINPGSFNTSSASCGSGTLLVGGGFLTTAGSSSVMRIYANRRSTTTGSTWQASAQNTTGSSKSVTAYAYCLSNPGTLTSSQTSGNLSSEGIASASCSFPSAAMGGGFVFPRTTAYTVMTMNKFADMYQVDMLPPPPSGDSSSKAYAECLAHP